MYSVLYNNGTDWIKTESGVCSIIVPPFGETVLKLRFDFDSESLNQLYTSIVSVEGLNKDKYDIRVISSIENTSIDWERTSNTCSYIPTDTLSNIFITIKIKSEYRLESEVDLVIDTTTIPVDSKEGLTLWSYI